MSADVFSEVPRFFSQLKDALYGTRRKSAGSLLPLKQITFRTVLTSSKVGAQNINTDLCLAAHKQGRLPVTSSMLLHVITNCFSKIHLAILTFFITCITST